MRLLYVITIISVFLASLIFPQIAGAYIDSGTGASFFSLFGTILAVIVAGFAAISAFFVRHYLKVKNAAKKMLKKPPEGG
ncbi:MAG: hypothetical protein HQK96_07065 [Nitrospirae bacterium]|nr:hypothetical protein [Nitrospirota bacterium]